MRTGHKFMNIISFEKLPLERLLAFMKSFIMTNFLFQKLQFKGTGCNAHFTTNYFTPYMLLQYRFSFKYHYILKYGGSVKHTYTALLDSSGNYP